MKGDWQFDEGDVIEEELEQFAPGGIALGKEQYTVKRRLVQPSTEERFYHVETQEGGMHLYASGAVEGQYEVVDSAE
jgi:hypothetical protein